MAWVRENLQQAPEILLFLSLALGFWVGRFQFGKFQLGGVAGSLLVAVGLSLLGVSIDNGVKALLFALFIYAVGFESGPQFFNALGRQSLREIILAVFMAGMGFVVVIAMAKLFALDKGLAAGLAAGGMTQSAIIGTAGDTLSRLGLAPQELQKLQANVAIGYAVSYIFGSLGAIIICVNVLQRLMGREIRDDAIKAEAERLQGALVFAPGEGPAMPEIVGRLYEVGAGAGKTVATLERSVAGSAVTVERIKRNKQIVVASPDIALQRGDVVLVVGRRSSVVEVAGKLGSELQSSVGMELTMVTRDVVLQNPAYAGRSLGDIKRSATGALKHGIYITGVRRGGAAIAVADSMIVNAGDVITAYGAEQDLERLTKEAGIALSAGIKTDFVFHGAGLVVGLLIGLLVVRVGSIPLTLGSGGGALLSGLLFGWLRNRNEARGNLPAAASQILKDLGLAGFVAAVGLQSGMQAIQTIASSGLMLFLIGAVVTLAPLLLTMLFGRYVLRYDNVAVFAGALAGARSANPAFGEILDKAGNSVPTVPFAITYALANVFLTLLGPLIVAFA